MGGDGEEVRVVGAEVFEQRHPSGRPPLRRLQAGQGRPGRRGEPELGIRRPQDARHLLEQDAKPLLARAQPLLRPLPLDALGDRVHDRPQRASRGLVQFLVGEQFQEPDQPTLDDQGMGGDRDGPLATHPLGDVVHHHAVAEPRLGPGGEVDPARVEGDPAGFAGAWARPPAGLELQHPGLRVERPDPGQGHLEETDQGLAAPLQDGREGVPLDEGEPDLRPQATQEGLLDEVPLVPLPLRDVADVAGERRPVVGEDPGDRQLRGELAPVAPHREELDPAAELVRLARRQVVLQALNIGPSKGRRDEELDHRPSDHPVAAITEDLLRGRVEFDDPPVMIQGHQRVGRRLEDGGLPRLGLARLALGPLPLDELADLAADGAHHPELVGVGRPGLSAAGTP